MQTIGLPLLSTVQDEHSDIAPSLSGETILSYQQSMNGHAQRSGSLAALLAEHLELPPEEVQQIRVAALLHDIGKLAIPTAILDKPGPLTEHEWRTIRLHPQIGYEILSSAGGIWAASAPLVLQHHERWDGLGYPYGIAGEEILQGARILAVVDSYDAMTEQRPYKQQLQPLQALNELRRCSGTHYDPSVVEAILSLDADILLNHTQHFAEWASALNF